MVLVINVVVGITFLGFIASKIYFGWKNKVHSAELGAKFIEQTRLAERHVEYRETTDETIGAAVIDLKPYINAALTDSPSSPRGTTTDNLAELPRGIHIYAGIPFDVEGSIQLMGGHLKQYGKRYPVKIENIAVGRHCSTLHFLHGSSYLVGDQYGQSVAKIVLHYSNGETEEVKFVAGEQSFDWWGIIGNYGPETNFMAAEYTRLGGDQRDLKRPTSGTELAWVGSNPYLKQLQSRDNFLRLYSTTFANPRPAEAISTIDYVSTMTMTAPFLVALTVE